MTSVPLSVAAEYDLNPHIQHVFDDFSGSVADFVGRADRTTLKASLFDALRRTEVTLPGYSKVVPAFLRRIARHASAESLGKALRSIACRPNPMHLAGVPWQCLLERERRLALGLPPLPAEDLLWTLDYIGTVLQAARGDGSIFPCNRTGWHMRILDDACVAQLREQAEPLSSQLVLDLRRLCASLELYAFMLHGEHRDGSFDHGPYPTNDGKIVVFKDFTDLQNTFLPWAVPDNRLSHPAISILLVLDSRCVPEFNWAGTMTSTAEIYDHLEFAAVFCVDGVEPRRLDPLLWNSLEKEARAAQRKIFAAAAGWPAEQRIKYGSWLFSNHLQEIPRVLRLEPGLSREIVPEIGEHVEQEYHRLDFSRPSPVWAALRRPRPFTEITP